MPLALSHQQLWAQNVYIALVTLIQQLAFTSAPSYKNTASSLTERETQTETERASCTETAAGARSASAACTPKISQQPASKSTALLATDDHKCNLVPNLTQPSHKNWHPPKNGPTDLPTNLDAPNDDDSPSLPQPKIIQRLPSLVNHSQFEEGRDSYLPSQTLTEQVVLLSWAGLMHQEVIT